MGINKERKLHINQESELNSRPNASSPSKLLTGAKTGLGLGIPLAVILAFGNLRIQFHKDALGRNSRAAG